MNLAFNVSTSGRYFVPYNGGVILKHSWGKARQYCKTHGLKLASITSANESKTIQNFISKPNLTLHSFWIGLNDKQKEGHFKWSEGRKVNFTNWGYGEPNGGEFENCVEIMQKVERVWNDVACGHKKAIICEKRQRKMKQIPGKPFSTPVSMGKAKDVTPIIIGASVGIAVAVFIALLLLIIFCIRKRQKRRQQPNMKGKKHSMRENTVMDAYDDVATKSQSMKTENEDIKTENRYDYAYSNKEAELSPYIELGPQDEPHLYEDLEAVTPEIPRRNSKKASEKGGEEAALVMGDTPTGDYENEDQLKTNDDDYLQAVNDKSNADHYVQVIP